MARGFPQPHYKHKSSPKDCVWRLGEGAFCIVLYRVLFARSEARVLLAFFTVARASATDFKAAPPPWWGTLARTTGGGSVKGSTHYIQHKPISRPRCGSVRFCVSF